MRHFVCARVDLRRPDVADPARGGFSHRVLDAVLRRSLARQTCQDFVFLSMWGTSTVTTKGLANETMVCLPDSPDQFHAAGAELAAALAELARGHEHLLVTRIDTDDALAEDAVELLQAYAPLMTTMPLPQYLDAESIFQVKLGHSRPLLRSLRPGYVSPFVSVVTRTDDLHVVRDVMWISHGKVGRACRGGCRLPGLRALQLVHGHNLLNRVHAHVDDGSTTLADFLGEGAIDGI